MPDGQPRAGGVDMDGGRGDGQDAGAVAAAHQAVVVLAPPQPHHALEVDHRGQSRLRQRLVALDDRAHPLELAVGRHRLAFVTEQVELQVAQGHFRVAGEPGNGQPPVHGLDPPVTGPLPVGGELPQAGIRLPGRHEGSHGPDPAGIERQVNRPIREARDERARRGAAPVVFRSRFAAAGRGLHHHQHPSANSPAATTPAVTRTVMEGRLPVPSSTTAPDDRNTLTPLVSSPAGRLASGRLELPRPYGHRLLRPTRLPFRHEALSGRRPIVS